MGTWASSDDTFGDYGVDHGHEDAFYGGNYSAPGVDSYDPRSDPEFIAESDITRLERGARAREASPEGQARIREAQRRRDDTPATAEDIERLDAMIVRNRRQFHGIFG